MDDRIAKLPEKRRAGALLALSLYGNHAIFPSRKWRILKVIGLVVIAAFVVLCGYVGSQP